jgi:hypothetical protein
MDRKPQAPKYSAAKNYNANYIAEPIVDNDKIDTIYSNFSSGEYEDIIKIIQGNEILNFRNTKGETLIHAILRNPSSSLGETNILEIIQLLVHKNVSVNAMNEYNQIPLHLAAEKGYYEVIDYLISLKTDYNKIDNYGNAPIHYLIDKFVSECKEGEYFKESNKKLNKSLKMTDIDKTSKMDKYTKMTENMIILELIETINKFSTPSLNPNYLLNKINQIVKFYKFFKIKDIQQLADSKKMDIENIFKKHSSVPVETEIKTIFNSLIKEINNVVYRDFKIDNKQDKTGENEYINDGTLDSIKKIITSENNKCIGDYTKKVTDIENKIKDIEIQLEILHDSVYILLRIFIFSFYVKETIDNVAGVDIIQITGDIINYFYDDIEPLLFDFDDEKKIDYIIGEDELINDERIKFVRTNDFDPIPLPLGPYYIIKSLPLSVDNNGFGNKFYGFYIDSIINVPGGILALPVPLNTVKISDVTATIPAANNKCKLITLFNIITYINKYLTILKNLKFVLVDDIENYSYFYFNYITEVLVNICNNLAIFKNKYENIKINNIMLKLVDFGNKIEKINVPAITNEDKNIIGILISQLDEFPKDEYNVLQVRGQKNEDLAKLNSIYDKELAVTIKNLQEKLSTKNISAIINKIYGSILEINKFNNDSITFINTNYSLKYLDKYIEFIKNFNTTTKINNFVSNRFYSNDSKFPINFDLFQQKYFSDNIFTTDKINSVKKDLLKKYYDYDYNKVFYVGDKKFPIIKMEIIRAVAPAGAVAVPPVAPFQINLKYPSDEFTVITNNKFLTGYTQKICYDATTFGVVDKKSIFSEKKPFNDLIDLTNANNWLKIKDDFTVSQEDIPLVSLEHVKQLIQTIGYKIIELIDGKLIDIINETSIKLSKKDIPKKALKNINSSLDYLKKNKPLLKKVITEKMIIFLNSYIKIQINDEIISLLQNIFTDDHLNKLLTSSYTKLPNKLLTDISKYYNDQLHKYTINTMIPKILSLSDGGIFLSVTDALIDLNVGDYTKPSEKKLLLNRCVANNKIDILKDTLLSKINLRTLDRNGNTILNRLIDQYNGYAIQKVLDLDGELYTYKNNRGQTSTEYLFDVLDSINKNYSWEMLDKRIKTYELDLQVWIKSDDTFGDIELDESKHMIYNIILNSLYLFNESLWLILLRAPYGWKYEDKIKLKEIIKKQLKYEIEENLLIKSLTDNDKNSLKNKSDIIILNNKIDKFINELEKEITELENTNKQLEEEKKTTKLGKSGIDTIIVKNNNIINEKNKEIANLKKARVETTIFDTQLDKIFGDIETTELINEMNIEWEKYNKLIKDISNYYLPIINIINTKNTSQSKKYISYYNYSLLNLDYNKLDVNEIQVLINYYEKIINNIYGDFYDLEKYEDSEFNYINDTILNIIYLNLVNVIELEMFSAIIGYITSKYTDNTIVKKIIENYKDPKVTGIFDTIKNLLKSAIWDKLDMKNKDYPQNYTDFSVYENELKTNVKTIFILDESEEDNKNLNNIIKFYKGLVENVSYNIYNEIVNLLNDMKKNSLLFGILNSINKHKSKK